jgi:hypothetical protein
MFVKLNVKKAAERPKHTGLCSPVDIHFVLHPCDDSSSYIHSSASSLLARMRRAAVPSVAGSLPVYCHKAGHFRPQLHCNLAALKSVLWRVYRGHWPGALEPGWWLVMHCDRRRRTDGHRDTSRIFGKPLHFAAAPSCEVRSQKWAWMTEESRGRAEETVWQLYGVRLEILDKLQRLKWGALFNDVLVWHWNLSTCCSILEIERFV